MRLIRASELGEYSFCRRAWWLHVIQGEASANAPVMALGTAVHRRHGAVVTAGQWLRLAALLLAVAALLVWLLGR